MKFRAQLRELEQQRMAVLEAQWWKSEQAREAELAAMKADFTKLQQQTQAVLSTAQVGCLYDVAAWQEKRCSTCHRSHSRIPVIRTVMSMLQHTVVDRPTAWQVLVLRWTALPGASLARCSLPSVAGVVLAGKYLMRCAWRLCRSVRLPCCPLRRTCSGARLTWSGSRPAA